MKIIVALGGNALLQRGQPLTAALQLNAIQLVAAPLARLAQAHTLVITHGNGPQVGLLALQGDAYYQTNSQVPGYPLDVLDAQTQGMVGYLLEQELNNHLPPAQTVVTLVTRVEVDANDPAFAHPNKPIGPIYTTEQAQAMAQQHSWAMAADGTGMRRVVASPAPVQVLNQYAIRALLAQHSVVIAAGGGGIPVVRTGEFGRWSGVEAVVDKDLCSALLAHALEADCLLILTDVDAVYPDWGLPTQRALGRVTPQFLAQHVFAAGSMEPKVRAACDFVNRTGRPCHIGALGDLEALLNGSSGTTVVADMLANGNSAS